MHTAGEPATYQTAVPAVMSSSDKGERQLAGAAITHLRVRHPCGWGFNKHKGTYYLHLPNVGTN